jgi:hypothetical protein
VARGADAPGKNRDRDLMHPAQQVAGHGMDFELHGAAFRLPPVSG